MDRIILIKYGELTTKKGNRKLFIDTLYKNISLKLKKLDVIITRDISRMYIEYNSSVEELIINKIKEVFGIHAFLIAYKTKSNIEDIKNTVLEVLKNNQDNITFKVETKRTYKKFPMDSGEINHMLGGLILKKFNNMKVDVHNPMLTVHVEIREDNSYVYLNEYKGLGGYPVGTLGKGILMLSGGIDSPVAGYLAIKRGIKLDLVYFEAIPHTSLEARNKVIKLAKKLSIYGGEMRLIIVPFTKLQTSIYKNVLENYPITIMRRMMYRIAEKVAKLHNCKIIINGESIGQVASQTLSSMSVINNVTNMPVIRPVACMDKLEIIEIAKKIGTYETSILPYEDCCTIFLPKHPVINPELDKCIMYESKLNYEELVRECVDNIETISNLNNKYEDLL